MEIDEHLFRSLACELIDENPCACRAVLSICRIEFTDTVETLAVSLGRPSVLKVNLGFVREHCEIESHVKALLLHEFLHVLLRHTTRFDKMTPALNIALDAVINSIIHRRHDVAYSGVMSRYYKDAPGLLRLLRPQTNGECSALHDLRSCRKLSESRREEKELLELQHAISLGEVVADDVHDFCKRLRSGQIENLLDQGWRLIGGHDGDATSLDDLDPDVAARVLGTLRAIDGRGIWRSPDRLRQESLKRMPRQSTIPAQWRRATLPLLRRLIVPDPKSRTRESEPAPFVLPVLNSSDRRGCLRSLWNPILPEINWEGTRERPNGCVQVYLDVSGSMFTELDPLVHLLAGFRSHIRMPFWAFSNIVVPAVIRRGKLKTKGTGGTELNAVLKHIRKTRPGKALIITDGFVEGPPTNRWIALPCRIEALISPKGTSEILGQWGIPTTRLAPMRFGESKMTKTGLAPPRRAGSGRLRKNPRSKLRGILEGQAPA